MNHLTDEQLVLHYYSDADDDAIIDRHLADCANCRRSLQELRQILALISSEPVPEPVEGYGSRVWMRLSPHLRRRRHLDWSIFMPRPGWALVSIMAVCILGAFVLGRYWPHRRDESAGSTFSGEVRDRVLLASISEQLDRSQMILTELSHARTEDEFDISSTRSWAHEILTENRLLRQGALRDGQPAVVDVLEDLERILLEIENSPARISGADLSHIQRRMDDLGIIFKMRLMGESLRQMQKADARNLARRIS